MGKGEKNMPENENIGAGMSGKDIGAELYEKWLGGEGRVALGAPIYTWSCGDGVTLTVRFELTGDADTPYPERMKAVYFTVIR